MLIKRQTLIKTQCSVCNALYSDGTAEPIIDSLGNNSSSINSFPFHNWYNFVLGYSPKFPHYMLERENIASTDMIVDPFIGSGTTLISCKMLGIPSMGIDANDFMVDAARTKLHWNVGIDALKRLK